MIRFHAMLASFTCGLLGLASAPTLADDPIVPYVRFEGGSGHLAYDVGVSDVGNLTRFTADSVAMLHRDGYCVSSFRGQAFEAAWQYGGEIYGSGDGDNFGLASIIDESPLTIVRDTTAGRLRLRQSFSFSGSGQSLTVTAVVLNISADVLTEVRVARAAEFRFRDDRDDEFGQSHISAWVFDLDDGVFEPSIGLMGLRALNGGAEVSNDVYVINKCVPATPGASPGPLKLQGPAIAYTLGTLKPGKYKTVRWVYFRQ